MLGTKSTRQHNHSTNELKLAEFVYNLQYNQFSPSAVEATKLDILDVLGVAIAGSAAPGSKEVIDLLAEFGGAETSSVFLSNLKVPPHSAALANATMAHALDFDDTHDLAVLHAGVTVVPAALAVAEYMGDVTGKEFITAVASGIEVNCRMGLATRPWIGWMLTPLYGYFGAATSASKLLKLDTDGLINAWGIAYSQAAGNVECITSGALTKRLQAGLAASGGVLAALFARKGITGARESMEGKAGIFNLYQRGEYDDGALIHGLGGNFEVEKLSYKPYPCCRFAHTAIDATLDLVRRNDIEPEKIAKIDAHVSKEAYALCEPEDVKRNPRTIVDAQFSIPYTVAVALLKKKVGIEDFTDLAIRHKAVLAISNRVNCTVSIDPDQSLGREIAPSEISVRLTDGISFSKRVDFAKGHPENPMGWHDLENKFQNCLSQAPRKLSAERGKKLFQLLKSLEDVSNIKEVTELLRA